MNQLKTFCRLGLLLMLFCPTGYLFCQENGDELNQLGKNEAGILFDDVRKERPPRPTGEAADIRFPSDFLTLSVPVEEPKKPEVQETSLGPEKKADSEVMIAVVLSIIIFGVFTWTDYRYRQTIQQILAKNRRLLEGEAIDIEAQPAAPAPALAGLGGGTAAAYPIYSEQNHDSSGIMPIHRYQEDNGGF